MLDQELETKLSSELVLQILPLLARLVMHAEDLVAFTTARWRVNTAVSALCEPEKVDKMARSPTAVKGNIKSWQQLEKATNKKCFLQSPNGPSDSVKERRSSSPCYAAEQDLFGHSIYLHKTKMYHALKAPFPPAKGGDEPLSLPTLCVSEVRGEGVLMGSGFEHVLV